MKIKPKFWVFCFFMFVLLSGCSTMHKTTQSKRTAIEQLLLSESVTKSLSSDLETPLPMSRGADVFLDISGISADKQIVKDVVVGWLGKQGYFVQEDKKNAQYQVSILVDALGTEHGSTLVGLPSFNSAFLPISLPELALFKAQQQTGYVKFYFNIFELPSNRYIRTVSPFIADTFYNEYVVLFVFSFKSTDLLAPPQIGLNGQAKKKSTKN